MGESSFYAKDDAEAYVVLGRIFSGFEGEHAAESGAAVLRGTEPAPAFGDSGGIHIELFWVCSVGCVLGGGEFGEVAMDVVEAPWIGGILGDWGHIGESI